MDLQSTTEQKNPLKAPWAKERSKTAERMTYEAEVDVIKKQIGDLDDIRDRLGLSARKMAQLLMVDPSAWTRWTKKITPPPPHIYRALQWYLILFEKNPGFTPQIFLSHRWHSQERNQLQKTQELEQEIILLKEQVRTLKTNLEHQFKVDIKEDAFRMRASSLGIVKIISYSLFLLAVGIILGKITLHN